MIDISRIADRHCLAAAGLAESFACTNQNIRILVSDTWAQSRSGQLLLSCLVNLLCRQPGIFASIEIVAKSTHCLIRLPNGEIAEEFPSCLEKIGAWATNSAVAVSTCVSCKTVDQTVVVGEVQELPSGDIICGIGAGWKAWVGTPDNLPRDVSPQIRNPLGPFLAAALIAGELFKKSRGILRGQFLSQTGYSLWSGLTSPHWAELEDGPEIEGRSLAAFHLIGAGAVGNATAYLLANMSLQSAYVAVIDDDSYDETNLNRCLLAGWKDVERQKVDAIGKTLLESGVGFFGFPHTVKDYLASGRHGLRDDMETQAREFRFEIVMSCVDRGMSRQDIQGLVPELLIGASTLGLAARANLYPQRRGAACLACFNPAEDDGEKIRTLEKELRGMSMTDRKYFLVRKGIDPSAVQAWLDSPECGTVAEASIKMLATKAPPQFSVGFVSLGAALLGISAMLRHALFNGKAVPHRADMSALNFINGQMMDSYLAPDPNCNWRCQARRA